MDTAAGIIRNSTLRASRPFGGKQRRGPRRERDFDCEIRAMAFGWSFPKLALFLTLGFFLVGIPLIAYGMALRERCRQRTAPKGERRRPVR